MSIHDWSKYKLSWNDIAQDFFTRYDDVFLKRNAKAHFDFCDVVIDGAKERWRQLLLLDAILSIIMQRLPSDHRSIRRQFEHHEIFRDCVIQAFRKVFKAVHATAVSTCTCTSGSQASKQSNSLTERKSINGKVINKQDSQEEEEQCANKSAVAAMLESIDNVPQLSFEKNEEISKVDILKKFHHDNLVVAASMSRSVPSPDYLTVPSFGPNTLDHQILTELFSPWDSIDAFKLSVWRNDHIKKGFVKRKRIIDQLCDVPLLQGAHSLALVINQVVMRVIVISFPQMKSALDHDSLNQLMLENHQQHLVPYNDSSFYHLVSTDDHIIRNKKHDDGDGDDDENENENEGSMEEIRDDEDDEDDSGVDNNNNNDNIINIRKRKSFSEGEDDEVVEKQCGGSIDLVSELIKASESTDPVSKKTKPSLTIDTDKEWKSMMQPDSTSSSSSSSSSTATATATTTATATSARPNPSSQEFVNEFARYDNIAFHIAQQEKLMKKGQSGDANAMPLNSSKSTGPATHIPESVHHELNGTFPVEANTILYNVKLRPQHAPGDWCSVGNIVGYYLDGIARPTNAAIAFVVVVSRNVVTSTSSSSSSSTISELTFNVGFQGLFSVSIGVELSTILRDKSRNELLCWTQQGRFDFWDHIVQQNASNPAVIAGTRVIGFAHHITTPSMPHSTKNSSKSYVTSNGNDKTNPNTFHIKLHITPTAELTALRHETQLLRYQVTNLYNVIGSTLQHHDALLVEGEMKRKELEELVRHMMRQYLPSHGNHHHQHHPSSISNGSLESNAAGYNVIGLMRDQSINDMNALRQLSDMHYINPHANPQQLSVSHPFNGMNMNMNMNMDVMSSQLPNYMPNGIGIGQNNNNNNHNNHPMDYRPYQQMAKEYKTNRNDKKLQPTSRK